MIVLEYYDNRANVESEARVLYGAAGVKWIIRGNLAKALMEWKKNG